MKRLLLAAVLALGLVGCVCNEKQSAPKCAKAKVTKCKAKAAKVAACPKGCKCAKCKAKAAKCSAVKASKCSK